MPCILSHCYFRRCSEVSSVQLSATPDVCGGTWDTQVWLWLRLQLLLVIAAASTVVAPAATVGAVVALVVVGDTYPIFIPLDVAPGGPYLTSRLVCGILQLCMSHIRGCG